MNSITVSYPNQAAMNQNLAAANTALRALFPNNSGIVINAAVNQAAFRNNAGTTIGISLDTSPIIRQ